MTRFNVRNMCEGLCCGNELRRRGGCGGQKLDTAAGIDAHLFDIFKHPAMQRYTMHANACGSMQSAVCWAFSTPCSGHKQQQRKRACRAARYRADDAHIAVAIKCLNSRDQLVIVAAVDQHLSNPGLNVGATQGLHVRMMRRARADRQTRHYTQNQSRDTSQNQNPKLPTATPQNPNHTARCKSTRGPRERTCVFFLTESARIESGPLQRSYTVTLT